MSDSRSISGSVDVTSKGSVASTAYEMAQSMWIKQFGDYAKADEPKFIYLVGAWSRALGGTASLSTVKAWLDHYDAH